MLNEIVFIFHCTMISIFSLAALFCGSHALVTFICIQCILANLFVLKQISLFGFTATCADAFTVGATLGLNLLQEYYGAHITKKAIWINFVFLVFYLIATQIHIAYAPAVFDITQQHFVALLGLMPRIVIASFSVYFLVQMLDYCLYGLLKKKYADEHLILRNYFSIAFCQLIDTLLFSFLGLYGLVENIWHIIFISYAVKMMSIIIATPFVGWSRRVYALVNKGANLF